MPIFRLMRGALAAGSLALLFACGGGGGGGGGDGGALPPLPYSGNTNAAVVTTSNASGLVSGVFGSSSTADAIAGISDSGQAGVQVFDAGQIERGRRLGSSARDALRHALGAASKTRPLAAVPVPFDETLPCASGSIRIFGTIDDMTGTGTLTIQYNSCAEDGETINGQGTFRVDAVDFGQSPPVPIDFTISFPRLQFRAAGISRDVGGSLRVQLSGLIETLTQNLVTLNNLTDRMTRTVDFLAITTYDNLFDPTSISSTFTGRHFDSVHGFVDVATTVPLHFTSITQLFPQSGQMTLMGLGGRAIRATAASSTLATLALDLDGNGGVDRIATLAWLELSTTSGADLADDDGDGMHNGWEDAKGLAKDNAADAALDPDADTFTSLQEYQAGTHPNDAASFPLTGPGPGSGSDPTPIAFFGHEISLPFVRDLVYDAVSQKLYAAVSTGPGSPGSVVPIDPVSGVPSSAIAVGNDPSKLAISDNGQYLYVGFEGQSSVQRINLTLTTPAVDLTIALGTGSLGPLYADDIAVFPGSPQSFALSLRNQGFSPRHEGVAIYDNGVRRANVTPGHTGANVIEFSASADLLYGYNNETTEFGFRRMAVNASGVTVSDVHDSFNLAGALIEGFSVDMRFDGGRIYSTTGRVIDPVNRTILGTFVLPAGATAVAPDTATPDGRVYFLSNAAGWTIRAYAQDSVQPPAAIMSLPAVTTTATGLLRCGANCLAYITTGGVGGGVIVARSAALVP